MKALRKFEAIQWKAGQQRTIEERTVDDEYTYLFIDFLPPRKFTTYPIDLEDFTIGYCLGEGLIKDYSDIESIKVEGTNVLVSTRLSHLPEEDLEQEGIVQDRKGNCEHACVCRLLEYNGVLSDNAGGIRSELKTIEKNTSDLTIDARDIIEDMEYLKDHALIWSKTASVHVAQLVYQDKRIIREDVSRHVAVDKVIGAAAKEGYDFSQCYITYSGRMPADMLIKVIRVGIPIIISNAAPAGSGIDVALAGNITMIGFVRGDRFTLAGNITMIGFVRGDRFTIYTAPERVNMEE